MKADVNLLELIHKRTKANESERCAGCRIVLLTKDSLISGYCFYCRHRDKLREQREKIWDKEQGIILDMKSGLDKQECMFSHEALKEKWIEYGIRYEL